MNTLNLVMIVKNEERCLARCLSSIKDLVDDIIVADTGSTDDTKQIASSFGAKLYDYTWANDFAAARNFALSKSSSDWNLILDADEYLVQGERQDLLDFLKTPNSLGAIQIKNAYMDHGELSYGIDYTTRIIPKDVYYTGKIHEQVDSKLERVPLPLVFEHDGYLMPNKSQRNLPILLEELSVNPKDPYILYQVATSLVNMDRHAEAVEYFEEFYIHINSKDNFYRKGILRYLYALLEIESFDRALDIINTVHPNLQQYADFHFLCGIFYMKLILSAPEKHQHYLPLIEQSYLNCLEIGEVTEHQGVYGVGSFKAQYNLGVWYESAGNLAMAKKYYRLSAREGYEIANHRLKDLHSGAR